MGIFRNSIQASRRRVGGPRPLVLPNKRRADGKPLWYAFIDESGGTGNRRGTFVISAIVTDDPEALSGVVNRTPPETLGFDGPVPESSWAPPGSSELKHRTSCQQVRDGFMEGLGSLQDTYLFSVTVPLGSAKKSEAPSEIYASALWKLIHQISVDGPPGVYRFRVDWHPPGMALDLETLVLDATKGGNIELADVRPVLYVESDLVPEIQAADMLAGEHKRLSGDDRGFVSRYRINRLSTGQKKRGTRGARHPELQHAELSPLQLHHATMASDSPNSTTNDMREPPHIIVHDDWVYSHCGR